MSNNNDPFQDFDKRLSEATHKKAGQKSEKQDFESRESKSSMGIAFRIGIEMVSGVIVGGGLGLLIDHYFGTSPWGMIIFFFLGCAAGILNVYKATQRINRPVGLKEQDKTDKSDP